MSRASHFYQVGGALASDVPSYVERAADEELYRQVREGSFCYVLTTRQMGKTSLMVRTAERVSADGTHVVTIDLTGFGTHEHSVTVDQWYFGIAYDVLDFLNLEEDLDDWWGQRTKLPPLQRLLRFLRDVVLAKTSGPVVIFLDEIDSTLNLSFASDLFAGIRSCYNARAENSELNRLTFVLLGVASPTDLISDPRRTPFNIGTAIPLTDFTLREALPLAEGLGGEQAGREEAMQRVLFWTGGHPYLTQKVCLQAADASHDGVSPNAIDRLVEKEFLSSGADRREPNLNFVRNRILDRGALTLRLLRLYRRVLRGRAVPDNPTTPVQTELKLAGLVKTSDKGTLVVRNEIYRRVFGEKWLKEAWPPADTPMRVAVAAVILLLLSPLFWYEVFYPRQFIHTLTIARGEEVNLAHDAYEHLRKIAFHGGQAETLWGELHARRASLEKHRDAAILLWLMALKAEPSREDYRRNAIKLVEPDYTRLIRTIRTNKRLDGEDLGPLRFENSVLQFEVKVLSHDGRLLAMKVAEKMNPDSLQVSELDRPAAQPILVKPDMQDLQVAAFSPDGRRLATGQWRGRVLLWRVDHPTAKPVLLEANGEPVRALAFSKDGRRLVVASKGGTARVWRVDEPKAEPVLIKTNEGEILSVAFSPDGTRVVTAWNLIARLWRVDEPTVQPICFVTHDPDVLAVAFSPDGKRMATAGDRGTAQVWRVDEPDAEAVLFKQDAGEIVTVAFSPDGKRMVTAGADSTARLWLVDEPEADPVLIKAHGGPIVDVTFSPDGERLVTVDWGGTVRLWLVKKPPADPLSGNPESLLAEWQKKLALKIKDNGEIIPAN